MAQAGYDPGSTHWGRPPVDSMVIDDGGDQDDEDDEDDFSDQGEFRMTGSHLVDKYIKTMQARQSGDGAPVRHETPADFDATLMSEGFDDANSTLGSHFSVRQRDSRDYDRDFRATPKDPKPVSHLANGYQQRSRDSIRRGDGESDVNRSSGLSESGGNARFAGNAARYTNGHSATTGGKPIIRDSDISMLASPPDDYSEDDTLSASVVARNLEQYNSLARSHHDSSYGPAVYHRQQAGEADGASARHQPKAPAANHPPSQQRAVAMAIQGLSAQQSVDERGASRQTNTQPEDGIDYAEEWTPPAQAARHQQGPRAQRQQGRMPTHQLSLHDVVSFLNSRDTMVVANAAGYLQHASYNNDHVKAELCDLGAIPALVGLILQRDEMVQHAAVGVLRNISYGPRSTQNKYGICESGGVEVLVRLLRNARSEDVQELVTGVLWNLSSCEELKMHILSQCTTELVRTVIVPASGWDPAVDNANDTDDVIGRIGWTPVLRNATGILRNLSSAGPNARDLLRSTEGLADALLRMLRTAAGNNEVDNKSVENSMCVLRNLSFRMESEVDEDSQGYAEEALKTCDWEQSIVKERADYESAAKKASRKESKKSFRWSRKSSSSKRKRPAAAQAIGDDVVGDEQLPWKDECSSFPTRRKAVFGLVQLFQPEVVQPYVALAAEASNPETLEAAAGAIQNLTACNWKWSVFIRNAVRKERGLPILSELLTIPSDAVVRTAATALRNLAVDPRNRELIGKFAMRDLVWRLPGEPGNENISEATVAAVLCCIQELVSRNDVNSRLLSDFKGIKRIVDLSTSSTTPPKLSQIANRTCLILSNSKEMRVLLKQEGWMYSYFVSSTKTGERETGDAATLHSISDSRANVYTSSDPLPNNRSAQASGDQRQTPVEQSNASRAMPSGTGRSQANIAALTRQDSRPAAQYTSRPGDTGSAPANIVQQQDTRQQDAARALRQQPSVEKNTRQAAEPDVRMQTLSNQAERMVRQLSVDDTSWV